MSVIELRLAFLRGKLNEVADKHFADFQLLLQRGDLTPEQEADMAVYTLELGRLQWLERRRQRFIQLPPTEPTKPTG